MGGGEEKTQESSVRNILYFKYFLVCTVYDPSPIWGDLYIFFRDFFKTLLFFQQLKKQNNDA